MQLRSIPCAASQTKDAIFFHQAETKKRSEKVLQSFNTWAFKRQQPAEPAELLRFIEWSVARSTPIQFVLYWGKGPRTSVAEPDNACLRFLYQMGERIRAVYSPGVTFTLIATDTHAAHNGHSRDDIAAYFLSVTEAASEFGYSLCYLSATVDAQRDRISTQVTTPSDDLLEKLQPCAEKWYRGQGESAEGAAIYFEMNMLEKQAVELQFPHAIFITFNNSDFRDLFPERLPVFYMYSLRKGSSIKPWFISSDLASAQQAECIELAEASGSI